MLKRKKISVVRDMRNVGMGDVVIWLWVSRKILPVRQHMSFADIWEKNIPDRKKRQCKCHDTGSCGICLWKIKNPGLPVCGSTCKKPGSCHPEWTGWKINSSSWIRKRERDPGQTSFLRIGETDMHTQESQLTGVRTHEWKLLQELVPEKETLSVIDTLLEA